MNISKLVSKLERTWKSTNNIKAVAQSALGGISSLMPALNNIVELMNERLPGYDAFILGFTGDESLLDQLYGVEPDDVSVEISNDAADTIVSGITQCAEILEDGATGITVTDRCGYIYQISVDSNDQNTPVKLLYQDGTSSALLWKENNKYYLATRMLPFNSPSMNANTRSISNNSRFRIRSSQAARSSAATPAIEDLWNRVLNTPGTVQEQLAETNNIFVLSATALGYTPEQLGDRLQLTPEETQQLMVTGKIDDQIATDIIDIGLIDQSEDIDTIDTARPISDVVTDLVASSEINSILVQVCQSIKASRVAELFANASTIFTSKIPAVSSFVKMLASAFAAGGVYQLVRVIINYFSVKTKIQDGCFTITDNGALVPRDAIVGIVGAVISGALGLVGMVTTIVSPIIGVIVSTAGSLIWSIVGSMAGMVNETKASINDESTTKMNMILPYAPFWMDYGYLTVVDNVNETLPEYQWVVDSIGASGGAFMIEVPGGALFFGPAEYGKLAISGDSDDSINVITKVAWEFHPRVLFCQPWVTAQHMSSIAHYDPDYNTNHYWIDISKVKYQGGREWLTRLWAEILNDPDIANATDLFSSNGTSLSDDADLLLRSSIYFSTIIWLLYTSMDENYLDVWYSRETLFVGMDTYFNGFVMAPYVFGTNIDSTYVPSWVDLLRMSDYHDPQHSGLVILFKYIEQSPWYQSEHTYNPHQDILKNGAASTILEDRLFINALNELPSQFAYVLNTPTLNASSFWRNLIVTAVITGVITIASVVVSLKISKKIKRGKFERQTKYDQAREKAQLAQKGLDEDEEPLPSDWTDEQVAEYQDQCWKSYYKTAKVNNRWANVVGGSRYDVTSFYGDGEDPDAAETAAIDSQAASLATVFYSYQNDAELPMPEDTQLVQLRKLITGY